MGQDCDKYHPTVEESASNGRSVFLRQCARGIVRLREKVVWMGMVSS